MMMRMSIAAVMTIRERDRSALSMGDMFSLTAAGVSFSRIGVPWLMIARVVHVHEQHCIQYLYTEVSGIHCLEIDLGTDSNASWPRP